MMFADKLLQAVNLFPTGLTPPSNYTAQTIVNLSWDASYSQGIFTESGWYRVQISGYDGNGATSSGGRIVHVFYAYSGTKYLIWGCYGENTGYPVPSGNGGTKPGLTGEDGILGGGGASGVDHNFVFYNPNQTIMGHGSGGGGSPTGNGGVNSTTYKGGGGCGFICGVDEIGTTLATQTEAFIDPNYAGFSVDSVTTMVLGAGGGGYGSAGCGGGGGAYGNGGNTLSYALTPQTFSGGTGPGGALFGAGADGTKTSVIKTSASGVTPATYDTIAGHGGDGAWCVRDYSTNTFTSGTGQGSPINNGVCLLEKLIY